MANSTLKDIIQGLIDTDTTLIERVLRGSGTYAILDINTPGRGGSGSIESDAGASHNKACVITTSSSSSACMYSGVFPEIKYGHYAICARMKVSNLTSSNLVQLKLFNGNTLIKSQDYKGTAFASTSQYDYIYTTFNYEGSTTKQDLRLEVHVHAINSVVVKFDYAYISMIIPSVFI